MTADALMKLPEIVAKLHLDDTVTSFAEHQQQVTQAKQQALALISTIKVPIHLRKLNSVLPKPCYPDIRPNSPTAWTVAEQKKQAKKQAPLPPVPQPPAEVGTENEPPASNRSEKRSSDAAAKAAVAAISNAAAAGGGYLPMPPPSSGSEAHSILQAVDEYSKRKPLAPMPQQPIGSSNASSKQASAPHRQLSDQHGLGYNMKPAAYHPSLDPISSAAPSAAPPTAAFRPQAPSGRHAAGVPTRLKYRHHRMW